MDFQEEVRNAHSAPDQIEDLYQIAIDSHSINQFRSAIDNLANETPDNLLYQAWKVRLQRELVEESWSSRQMAYWKIAIPIAILSGITFWILSNPDLKISDHFLALFLVWAPIAAFYVMVYLNLTNKTGYKWTLAIVACLIAGLTYIFLMSRGLSNRYQEDYLTLMIIQMPLLAWIAVGIYILWKNIPVEEHFAFLIKSFEVFITAGIYVIAGGVFTGITIGLFEALNLHIPELGVRFILAGGGGLIPVLAVASVYDPNLSPAAQDFKHGISRYLAIILRLLLPLTLVVLVIYLMVIPTNFNQPFENRDVLIVYNLMLFAIMGLLIGATPVDVDELSQQIQMVLRYGILLVAMLAVIVSLYAMSATLYRTIYGGLTINRLTIIGWNSINIVTLILLIYWQIRFKEEGWVNRIKRTFRVGSLGYCLWLIFTLIAIPIIFR